MGRLVLFIMTSLFASLTFAKSTTVFYMQDETQLIHLPLIDEKFFGTDNRTVEELESAISSNPNETKAYIRLCYLLKEKGEHDLANEYAKRGIESNMNDKNLLNIAGAVLIHSHETEELYNICLKAVATNPKNADAYNLLGVIAHQNGNSLGAITHFQRALALKKRRYNWINFNLANAYRAAERYDDAAELYRKSAKKFLADKNFVSCNNFHFRKPNMVWVNNNIGLTYTMKGDYTEANKAYREALSIKNSSSRVYNGMACTYYEMGEMDSCLVLLDKAIKANPRYASPYKNLGNINYEKGNFSKALEYFNKAYELDSTDEWLISKIACCHKNMKDYEKAIGYFNKAIGINHTNGENHYQKGLCYHRLGDTDKANESFNTALKLGYEQARGWIRK
ncbi:MAG: tetratricopeptide repeat protein [Paludibacteraceae bacterium]|nr:tetratricopeptide repeat protein [Paludibacteraceae bacterium]